MSASRQAQVRLGLGVAGASALAFMAVAIAITIPQLTIKASLFMVVALGGALAVVMSGRAKEVLLGLYIIALTYNRQYFSFDNILGNNGSEGLYWIPGDPFLILLILTGMLESATGSAPPREPPTPVFIIAFPAFAFLVPCIVSALLAERPDLSFNELTRVVRFVVVLIWLQRNMTMSLWYTAIGVFTLSILLQAGLGTVQVVLHADRNLLSVFGQAGEQVLNNDGQVDVLDNRARGTLGHPNYLAPYLLTLLPACLGMTYYSRVRLSRLIAFVVLLAGVAGMIATKSRVPIGLMGISFIVVTIVAIRERRISLASAAGGAVLALTVLSGLAMYYKDAIYERIWGDFTASVNFRTEYNEAALEIWNDAPVFGIGPNNLTLGLSRHSAWFHWLAVQLEQFRGDISVRAVAPVHNVYLLILAETGVVGLFGFIILLSSVFRRSVRAFTVSVGGVRGICLGISVGLAVQFVQQTIDFSQWFDPSWYTLAVLMALVGSVPALRPVLR